MLTKRTNILFEENIFRYLSRLAAKNKTSVGDLVRLAVIKVYLQNDNSKKTTAFDKILTRRKNFKKVSSSDIKEFINYGRKL